MDVNDYAYGLFTRVAMTFFA
ncbi:MAG: hypothetical protein JWP42_4547, partial [Pseudomonas sp.]|nr:hypothetical protein [Pseudomonas sp.]